MRCSRNCCRLFGKKSATVRFLCPEDTNEIHSFSDLSDTAESIKKQACGFRCVFKGNRSFYFTARRLFGTFLSFWHYIQRLFAIAILWRFLFQGALRPVCVGIKIHLKDDTLCKRERKSNCEKRNLPLICPSIRNLPHCWVPDLERLSATKKEKHKLYHIPL